MFVGYPYKATNLPILKIFFIKEYKNFLKNYCMLQNIFEKKFYWQSLLIYKTKAKNH